MPRGKNLEQSLLQSSPIILLSGIVYGLSFSSNNVFELFFCKKKYLLVGASGMLWAGESVSGSVDQWMSERCMFVTPIRLDLPLETNQISCCKGKWYVRRFDPDTVENGHIYSSVKEEEVFIYWAYLPFSVG